MAMHPRLGLVLLLACPTSLLAQTAAFLPETDPLYREVLGLENRMMTAFAAGDRGTLDRIIGDEFILTSATSSGDLIGKVGYIAEGIRMIVVESFRFHDVRVRRIGDLALVYSRIDWRSSWNGKPWNADFLLTDVWLRRHGAWQIVSRHSSYPGSTPGGGPGRQPQPDTGQ